MLGFTPARRPARPAIVRMAPAALEALEGRRLLSASDLGLREVKSTLPDGIVTGTTVKGTVTVQVSNLSTAKLRGPQTFTLTGTAPDGTTITLGSVAKKNFPVGVNGVPKVAIPVKTIVTQADDYELAVQASDGTTASVAAAAGTLNVATAQVDLQATALTVSGKASNFLVNHAVTFKVTFVNDGNINTSSPLTAVLELSTDGTNPITPPLSVTPLRKGTVIKDTGKPVTLTYSVKLPETGTYYIGGTFTTSDPGTNTAVKFSSTQITVISKVA